MSLAKVASFVPIDPAKCKHNEPFYCELILHPEEPNKATYAMLCPFRCGFWLNFSPHYAGSIVEEKAPPQHWLDEWRHNTTAFHPYPLMEDINAYKKWSGKLKGTPW